MIFYFTGTGNSLYVSKEISKSLHEEIISIPKAIEKKEFSYALQKGETVGFIYPVHGWRPAKIVLDFIKKLNLKNYDNNYVYSVYTSAGEAEATAEVLSSALKGINITLKGNYHILMTGNYTLDDNNIPEEEENRRLNDAQSESEKIVKYIIDKKCTYKKERHSLIKTYIVGGLLLPFYARTLTFEVSDKCVSCGTCIKGCPVNALKIDDNKIIRNAKKCMLCLKCINCCPKEAIDFGNSTKDKRRYKHPEFKDIM